MTDEDMAEEFVDSKKSFWRQGRTCVESVKQAFLAGLKAGRPKWHKVADGDYPPCVKGNYTINVLSDKGDVVYYSYDYECWIAEPSSSEVDPPEAWCELPKYINGQDEV